jgi:hypothetical protein
MVLLNGMKESQIVRLLQDGEVFDCDGHIQYVVAFI